MFQPDDMIKLVTGLIESASSDADIRQKIAGLPQTVSDASGLRKIKGTSKWFHLCNSKCFLLLNQPLRCLGNYQQQ